MSSEKKNFKLGLDIGTNAVKILEIAVGSERPVLSGFGFKDIKGVSRAELPEIIKDLALQSKITSRDAAISVSGKSVIVRIISMPKMNDETLKNAIKFEAEKFIPFDINSCIIDHKTLKKEGADNQLSVLLVAAKKDAVLEKIKIAEEAGFAVNVVDIDAFAVANAFMKNFTKMEQGRTIALVNIGAAATNLCIIRNESVHFARDIAAASGNSGAAAAGAAGIDTKEAEKLMCADLAGEVKSSFDYYENQGGHPIDDVYLSGAVMSISGFTDVFQEQYGSKPLSWKPLDFLDPERMADGKGELKDKESLFAVAAGLVLR